MLLSDISNEFLNELSKFGALFEVFVCLYAIMKYLSTRNQMLYLSTKNFLLNITLSLMCLIISAIISITIYLLLTPFLLYKFLIILILRLQYKNNYAGLLKSADAIWVAENETSRNIINLLFFIQFDKSKRDLTEFVKEVCVKRFLNSTRLTCIRKEFMGYVCFIENQLTIDDIVSDITLANDIYDMETLQNLVQDYSNKPLPKNNTATWELLIGQQPVLLKGFENEGEQYPLLMRVHHSAGDGVTFLSVLIKYIADEGTAVLQTTNPQLSKGQSHLSWVLSMALKFWYRIKHIATVYVYSIMMFSSADRNLLHGPVLSGEKRLGFYIENKPKYLQIVKNIKSKIPHATFSDVMFTAISASLNEYFKKHSKSSPKQLILTFMAMANRNDLIYAHNDLKNIFSMGSIKLPININSTTSAGTSLIDRFLRTQKEYKKFSGSYDLWINNCMLKTFANVLPTPILKLVLRSQDVTTVAFSNLPGFKKIHISKQALNHMLFWVPNYLSTGVGFSILTYDDRFHMGLLVDKVLISDEKEVQQILHDVFKYIDLLNIELKLKNKV